MCGVNIGEFCEDCIKEVIDKTDWTGLLCKECEGKLSASIFNPKKDENTT